MDLFAGFDQPDLATADISADPRTITLSDWIEALEGSPAAAPTDAVESDRLALSPDAPVDAAADLPVERSGEMEATLSDWIEALEQPTEQAGQQEDAEPDVTQPRFDLSSNADMVTLTEDAALSQITSDAFNEPGDAPSNESLDEATNLQAFAEQDPWLDRSTPIDDQFFVDEDMLLAEDMLLNQGAPSDYQALVADRFVPPDDPAQDAGHQVWYLGIDFGTTGISAVLLNRLSCQLYPIYWSDGSTAEPSSDSTSASTQTSAGGDSTSEKRFRLSTLVSLRVTNALNDRANVGTGSAQPSTSVAIADVPVHLNWPQSPSESDATNHDAPDLLLRDFKPYLKLGVPHYSPQTSQWEPVLQWSERLHAPLSWLHQALQGLLATLSQPPSPSGSSCNALGLDEGEFRSALRQLAGVIVGYPANWSDTYSFNLREAILGARLVARPEQIFFIEDTIATLLSTLRSADGRDITLPHSHRPNANLHDADWQGNTLVINAGATVTELAIVNLPRKVQALSHQVFHTRSLLYAGNAIDQDIICQLLYPALKQQQHDPNAVKSLLASNRAGSEGTGVWFEPNWQTDMPSADFQLEAINLEHVGLENLTLPSPGEPDLPNRYRLQQRLDRSRSGQLLLEAARSLKLTLQQQSRFTLQFGDRQWVVPRQDLGSQVLLPYVQRLNRELNTLLSQTDTSVLTVNQVICTGGTASLGAIARWLRQKLPNATIIQDTYVRSISPQDNCISSCSRVAYGLAVLPLHPQVLDLPRQQYNDYFLLLELLRTFPNQPVSASEMMQILERRGINTQECHLHILALLEGHLPPGLVPAEQDDLLLTPESRKNPDYQAIRMAPLFHKQSDQTYRPNRYQWNHLRRYLDTLMASTHQKLTQPFPVSLMRQDER